VPPITASSAEWPDGLAVSVFDGIRKDVADNRSNFYLQLAIPFFGFNRDGVAVNEGLRQDFWRQGMTGGIVGQYACIREFSEVDYTADLRAIDAPTVVVHGDDDQIVPIGHAGALTAKIIPVAELEIYEGGSHGLAATHQDRFNADLLAFAKA
jgi:non-heme chloroperoxidase